MSSRAEGVGGFVAVLPVTWRSDAALLQRALDGDRRAATVLVSRLSRPAHALAWRLTGSGSDAEDVVQEAFCRLWQHGARFEARAQLSTWFLGIVRNLCMDRFRRIRPQADEAELEDLADEAPTPEQSWQQAAESGELVRAMAKLPERQRVALMMWAWQDHDVAHIARELQIAENAAHQLLFRARARLKTLLSEGDSA
ncbi:RNA polymerase sigma factor [Methyloversatilis thermotolerans]|uniref:RNA polymerase sigma factor n=1 Tax=Methyloversatilis thermotolerans TaxID=1346290 RepID=UPI000376EFF6|nr:sigma-70 family RNA polymerase sigma factor [Methyloversatilis thermotolerans]